MLDRDRLQRLYRYGYSLTRDEHRAYDLLQDAIEIALRKAPQDPQAMLRYIRTIMRNRFIDEYRRQQRHPMLSLPSMISTLSLLYSNRWSGNCCFCGR
jgi:DNA-directed RNA polymerase specialized sigma24 family protein